MPEDTPCPFTLALFPAVPFPFPVFFWSLTFLSELFKLLLHSACWYLAISGQEVFLYGAMVAYVFFLFLIQNNFTASRALTWCGCHRVKKSLKYLSVEKHTKVTHPVDMTYSIESSMQIWSFQVDFEAIRIHEDRALIPTEILILCQEKTEDNGDERSLLSFLQESGMLIVNLA